MANTEYRLDYEGLSYFWNKLKTYIGDQTGELEAALEDTLEAINTLKSGVETHENTDTVIASLTPNVLHTWGEITSLTIQALATPTDNTRYNEYMIQFSSGSTATVLDFPPTLTWLGGVQPTTRAGKTYQISIVNNLAVMGEF